MATSLAAGDIALVGYDADDPDDFAFVLLRDIDAGTSITFTDNGWNSTDTALRTAEGSYTYTAPTALTAGTVIHPTKDTTAGGANTPVYTDTDAPRFSFSTSGDQILAYQGSAANPTFLYAINFADGSGSFAANGTNANTSALPPGLILGQTAVALGADNGRYTGTVSGTRDQLLAAIGTAGSWSQDNAARIGAGSYGAFTVTADAVVPALSIDDVQVGEGDSGVKQLVFTVSLNAPAPAGGVSFDIATADGSAATGTDYVARALTGQTIAAGQTRATFAVDILGDTATEPTETFTVAVSNVRGATVADGQGTGTILTDDIGTRINGITVLDAAPSLQGLSGATATAPPAATNALQLVRLGAYAATNDPATQAAPNAEVVAYDSTTSRLYIQNTAENRIEIVALDATGALTKTGEIGLSGLEQYGAVNSVAVFNGLVAVAYANATGDAPGRVALFNADGTLLRSLTVGVGPDQIVFTRDGSRLVVANEGEQASAGSNPVGGISIIDVAGGAANAAVTATVGFEGLDGSEAALRARGLAITPGKSAAADIEPEYIAISPDNRFAYVTLQEVNGVAIIDLTNPGTAPIAIQPLGAVNHSLAGNEFDASDRDGPGGTASIRIATSPSNTPIYGLLQPDAVASFATGGATYFVTANEGDQRVIGGADDTADVARLSSIPNSRLTPELQRLKADPAYARLNVLLRTGDTDGDGVIDQLHTLGGRGISIFRQNADGTLTKVRETGGEFEKIFAQIAPERFNNDQTLANTPDDRSDNKGPEPEGITIGTVNGRIYAFVGLERQSGVIVYDVTDPTNAAYVSYVPPLAGATTDLGPEVLTFIAADRNPTGTALLVSANEVANGGAVLYAALPQFFTQEVGFAANSLAVSRAEGNAGESVFTFTVERSNGTLGAVAFTAELTGSGANAADSADFAGAPGLPLTVAGTIPAGAASAQVSVTVRSDALPEADETFALTLRSAASDQAGIAAAVRGSAATATGTILNDDASLISAVQGTGTASALVGRTVTIEAIVVGDFQNGDSDTKRNLGGLYLQEEATDQDGNPLTSEGVFVFEGSGNRLVDVNEGDRVRVTGIVAEFNGETQITVRNAEAIQVVTPGALTPEQVKASAVAVELPAAGTIGTGTTAQPDFERYEGMLVRFPQTLTITEQFNLDRFNEIRLAAGGRTETFTNEFEPNTAAYAAYLAQTAARTITYDDGQNAQNLPVENLDGFGPTYGTATAPRMGDTVTGLTGTLGFGPTNAYRVRAIDDGDNRFAVANPRPAEPDPVGGTLKVGSLNVLNYFTTLDTGSSARTAIGVEPRGANNAQELARQTEKLVTTLIGTGADVLGLTELENQFRPGDPGNALEYLVGQLNLRAGAGTYAYVNPGAQLDQGQFLGSDVIAVGFIYKPSKVSVAMNTTIERLDDSDVATFNPALLQQSTLGHIFNGANTSRTALAVTFNEIATNETFTAVINHFKSKGGTGTGADADQGDGQGAWQQQRELAATALAQWLALRPTGSGDSDTLLLGDFNAYIKEDALDILKANGFTNLTEDRLANPYSYVFDGAYGALDHALASASLNRQVTGVTEWHINADEADAIDYNLDFGRSPNDFDGRSPARESDHDPVLIGLRLDQTARSARQFVGVDALGSVTIPNGTQFDGTLVGGLSGLTRSVNGDYLAISDDKSSARAYALQIDLADGRLDAGDLKIRNVIRLTGTDGAAFPPSDPEGIAAAADGSFYVSSEGSNQPPFIKRFSATGAEIGTVALPDVLTRGYEYNRGIESLALTPDGRFLFTGTEHPLTQDAGAPFAGGLPSRIFAFDTASGQVAHQFVYTIDDFGADHRTDNNGLVDLIALDETHLLALERVFISGRGNSIRLYEVDTTGATDVSTLASLAGADGSVVPVQKTLLANLGFVPDFLAGTDAFVATGSPDNLEGMVLGPRLDDGRQTLLLVADNNFRGDARQITNVVAVALKAGANVAPAFSGLDGQPHFVPGGPAVVLDADVTIADPELDRANAGRGDYRGATLTIERDGGASEQDEFGGTTALAAMTEGGDLRYAGAKVGTVLKNSGGVLKLSFDGQAASAVADSVIQSITYKNSGQDQKSSVSLSYTFNDGVAASTGINKVEVKVQAMTYTLQILHASDWEGGLLATERAANFAAIVDRLEDATPNSITLSTGDGWIPSPFYIAGADPQMAATYSGVYNQLYGLSGAAAYGRLAASPGRADITIQNIIGVQAAVFGNHEFDAGPNEVANIIGANLGSAAGAADDTWVGAQFPYLSTNLNFSREAALSGLVHRDGDLATFAQTGPTSTQTGTGADKIAKSTILVENGERIAFIGATTQLEPLLTTLGNVTVDGFTGRDEIALLASQINAEVDRVLAANPGLNKVIVGTHLQQLANEQALAPLLRNVDVLIGGGSHTLLADGNDRLLPGDKVGGAYPQFFTNASGQTLALVNTASEYSYVGRLNVTFDDQGNVIRNSITRENSGAVAVDDATVAQLWGSKAAAFTPGSKGYLVREVIEGLDANNDGIQETAGVADVIRQQDGNILGRTSVYLEGRRGEVRTEETNLGNLSADANLWYARQFDGTVTVSIKNGGGIRDSIGSFSTAGGGTAELPPAANPSAGKAAGDISQLDVTNSLRFNNALAMVTVTAAELERVLEHAVSSVAPGATPGAFPQIGGISFSFDATKQAQTLDANGNVTREGQRILSAAIVDADGFLVDTLVQNGQLVGDANRGIRAVTLDFLTTGSSAAPGLGGDNYPFPAYGESRVALSSATPTSLPNIETFAAQGTEQDAIAEYLKAFYSVTPFGQADTGPAADTRIQNLAVRGDSVLARGVSQTGTSGNDVLQGTAFADRLSGGLGDDVIANSAGNDILSGGRGTDTLVFNASFADVTVTEAGRFTAIASPEGLDLVEGFERFLFSDATIVVNDGKPLVDDLYYLARNKDVFQAGLDAETHFAQYGAREGRDPNAFFSTKGYLAANPDVRASGVSPLDQYEQAGWKEGRDPGARFDNEFYLAANPDVKAAGLNPLAHYLQYGQSEGRAIHEAVGRASDIRGGFDAEFYLLANADVAEAAGTGNTFAFAAQHFEQYGWKEGRNPNAVFDTEGYLAAYGDVKAEGINPLTHYDQYGWKEGRDPSASFDTATYLSTYKDVAAAELDPMQHFLQYGLYEGRSDFADGGFRFGTLV